VTGGTELSNDDQWLQIDEQTDVIVSLSGCHYFAGEVQTRPEAWKHVITNLHNALQGAMVCHLSGTAQAGALDESSLRKISKWHDRDRRGEVRRVKIGEDEWGPTYRAKTPDDAFPDSRLADAATLFERLHEAEKRKEQAGTLLVLNQAHQESFKRLHKLRNDFAHFTPRGWSIQLAGLPGICLDLLEIIQMIEVDGWAFRHLSDERRGELIKLISSLNDKLQ
jgi:hypothetical protein